MKRKYIKWDETDEKLITDAAKKLVEKGFSGTDLQLFNAAMKNALAADKHRRIQSVKDVPWFLPRAGVDVKVKSEIIEVKPQVHVTVTPSESKPIDYSKQIKELNERLNQASTDLSAVRSELIRQTDIMRSMLAMLTQQLPYMKRLADDLAPVKVEPEPIAKSETKPANKLKIVIVGTHEREFQQIQKRVGDAADLVCLDRSSPGRQLPKADYCILTMHLKHVWWNQTVGAYGRDSVIKLPTTGTETITNKIKELVAENVRSVSRTG